MIGLGVSFIEAVAVMGNIEITVPPDVAVESDGDAVLGSFVVAAGAVPRRSPRLRDHRWYGSSGMRTSHR